MWTVRRFGIAYCLSVILTGMNELVRETKPAPAGPALSGTGLNTQPGCRVLLGRPSVKTKINKVNNNLHVKSALR